ncbi:hypothetical protein ES319_D11G341200v1, partial [Gossypium barbadense]
MLRFEPNSSWIPPFQCGSVELGLLPRVFPTLDFLVLSNNSFSGSLSDLVCNSSGEGWMRSLYIDANLLSGEIPDCWNHRFLNYLDLANNNLTGKIPPLLHKDLRLLNHRKNSMFGELPSTFESVPVWIGDKLSKLMGLCLRSNNFNGHIPHNICDLLSFKTWTLPITTFQGALLVMKGREDEYETTQGLVGNDICGPLLTKNCTTKGFSTDVTNNGDSNKRSKVNWLYVSIILGFVMGFWGVVAPLFLIRTWRYAYYQKLDHVGR